MAQNVVQDLPVGVAPDGQPSHVVVQAAVRPRPEAPEVRVGAGGVGAGVDIKATPKPRSQPVVCPPNLGGRQLQVAAVTALVPPPRQAVAQDVLQSRYVAPGDV